MDIIQPYSKTVTGRGTGEQSDAVTQRIKTTATQTWSILGAFSPLMVNLVLYLTSIDQPDPHRPPKPGQRHQ